MAGMEQLKIHSTSYLVRWINVPAGHSISWSIQPHKKSINFGIFKHPGTKSGQTPNLPSVETAQAPADGPATRPRASSNTNSRNDNSKVVEKLQSIGLKPVAWTGKCEADKVSMGKYDVPDGEGGMYGLVFDNTFSKQVSKTATFVLMTHPTNAAPKSGHHLHFSQAFARSDTSLGSKPSPALAPEVGDSQESLPPDMAVVSADPRPRSRHIHEATTPGGSVFYTGILQKKRRKKNQGYARRFFSLDFTSSTLSYYQNRQSSALRGAIPLSLAAIGANEKTREISVDSGAEVWHLKASNQKDFEGWKDALERASSITDNSTASPEDPQLKDFAWPSHATDSNESNHWGRVESLIGRIAGTRDAVRRLAKDTDPKALVTTVSSSSSIKGGVSAAPSPSDSEANDYFKEGDNRAEKSSFWKRKPSSGAASPSGIFKRSVSAQMAVTSPSNVPPVPPLPNSGSNLAVPKQRPRQSSVVSDEGIHENVMAILRDLDAVVNEASALLAESRARRASLMPKPNQLNESRRSIDSASSDEFFDATDAADGDPNHSQLLTIRRDSDDPEEGEDEVSDGASEASSDAGEGIGAFDRTAGGGQADLFPTKPKSLTPLPMDRVARRDTVPPAKMAPPSLIGFLRKNVGKDLSTIAMPVSANEPTSLLQRVAEQMEYSELLDAAAVAEAEDGTRILTVMAFAISSFSNARVKERAVRKPFNPMLGETFELVREDKGFRFVTEKVSHRPVRMACQAEAKEWTFVQSPMPVQKFWGKSAELNTDGRARVFFHSTSEHYSWTVATSFLRNIIAGEKYVEPVGTMTVINESTGAKAVATFKAGGMFAGRSEEVTVEAFGPGGQETLPLGLVGKWTSHLNLTKGGADTGKAIWKVGDLVDKAVQRYGFTTFAASLNEITEVERGHLPPTDSRLRPDQRAAEEGDLDKAEALKARLEERQRQRRRVLEEHGEEWKPRWFSKMAEEGGEEVWKLKSGKEGYWEERAKGEWTDVAEILAV
ncbi:oxysterol binding protein 1 [Saccharata proteae CBS 121410]|uniref:Oxysterol binding protein 1 n=1 Tax=Saccharata proteae CBS 121410 TaxID=1314787 RepID=A0A9P4LYS7_9PEZI|nr:oxysterol binding protein 1 [Saccharata proteae CBS 121410]